MSLYGYARVSTAEQDLSLQRAALKAAGCDVIRAESDTKPANAFVTVRKGFCYLTIKAFGRNHEMMRIRAYKIEPEEKRDMRRLYPDVVLD